MDRYRYLPQKPSALNPDGLPIGFTKGNAKANRAYSKISSDWLGMTCAACHTGQVEHAGARYLIDGAPSMADFESFVRDLVAAMQATLADDAKFKRFAAAVIADSLARGSSGTASINELRDQLRRMTTLRDDWNKRNQGTSDYGHARLDAIGAIFNETSATALGVPGNVKPANAPVSYPFIWDTPQHDKVQWNGSVTNAGPGALGRNVGEVLGVFGTVNLNTNRRIRTGHSTSINVANLGRLETLVSRLQSPRWRDTGLPNIDEPLAAKGREIFNRYCGACHHDIDRVDPARRVCAVMVPVANPSDANDPDALGTDPIMASNFLARTASAHQLTGQYRRYLKIASNGEKFAQHEQNQLPKFEILGYEVVGAITRLLMNEPISSLRAMKAGQPASISTKMEPSLFDMYDADGMLSLLDTVFGKLKPSQQCEAEPACFPEDTLPCYKARPLNGIWATAPYLHNGSVRTLRQLLLPAAQREESFKVGTRELDPVDIGFKNEGASTLHTKDPGNSKAGHDGPIYGNAALAADKPRMDALLEYLKTL